MHPLHAVILGTIQGLTEFLPVSSSGHLVVAAHFFADALRGEDALGFDILLHFGSLLAILVGFYDVWSRLLLGILRGERASWRMAALVIVATVPGVVAGLFLEHVIATQLRSLSAVAVGFLVTAGVLVGAEAIGRKREARGSALGVVDAMLIGLAQAVAILPGVSRSGLTVSAARAMGMKRSDALDFSFLMALPIITGAVAKTALDAFKGEIAFPPLPVAFAGFAASAAVSLCAVLFLRRFVRQYSFAWFAWYLVPLALLLLGEDAGVRQFLDAPHAREAVRGFGAAAVFAFAFIEVIPPFSIVSPGVSALVLAGSLAPDPLSLFFFILAASSASFLGNVALYAAGHYAGPSLERAMRLSETHRAKAESFVRRSGAWGVVAGQFSSLTRPTIAFAAGVLRMPKVTFLSSALLGACAWGASGLIAGYVLRENIRLVISILVSIGAVALLGLGIYALIEWSRARRTAAK